jgi:hypothetical protein
MFWRWFCRPCGRYHQSPWGGAGSGSGGAPCTVHSPHQPGPAAARRTAHNRAQYTGPYISQQHQPATTSNQPTHHLLATATWLTWLPRSSRRAPAPLALALGPRPSPSPCMLHRPRPASPPARPLAAGPAASGNGNNNGNNGSGRRQDSQITAPPSERRGRPGARHFARWKQIRS